MGLESHVDTILQKKKIERGKHYEWNRGLIILGNTELNAERVMQTLDESGEFGPTRFNRSKSRVEFGLFSTFFDGDSVQYEQYRKNFKQWLVNKEGELYGLGKTQGV